MVTGSPLAYEPTVPLHVQGSSRRKCWLVCGSKVMRWFAQLSDCRFWARLYFALFCLEVALPTCVPPFSYISLSFKNMQFMLTRHSKLPQQFTWVDTKRKYKKSSLNYFSQELPGHVTHVLIDDCGTGNQSERLLPQHGLKILLQSTQIVTLTLYFCMFLQQEGITDKARQ